MRATRRILTITVLAAVAVGVVIAINKANRIRQEATEVADNIESELDDLDPVTRKAVMAKLSADALKGARARMA